jgi:DNA protecting protein DprA
MDKDIPIIASLTCFPRFGGKLYTKLIDRCKSIGLTLTEFYFLKEEFLRKDFDFFSKNFLNQFIFKRNEIFFSVKNELNLMKNSFGVHFVTRKDENYPKKIIKKMDIYSPPILYIIGNIDLFEEFSLAIIGSRKPSNEGLSLSGIISKEESLKDKIIISGYANGIDYQAHLSALSNFGKTIFVLPKPIIKFDNRIVKDLKLRDVEFPDINNKFLIISEFLRFSPISYKSMPIVRNRLVAALSDEVIVIEAGLKSGTIHTTVKAMEFGINTKVIDFSYMNIKNPDGNIWLINKGLTKINPLKYLNKRNKKTII